MAKSSQLAHETVYALEDFHGSKLLRNEIPRPPAGGYESPKVILSPGLSFGNYAIHVVALLATGGVACLSFANVYAFDEGISSLGTDTFVNDVLHLLQFVAKIHEIIILGSLTAIVMFFLRRRLTDSKGVPLGLLTSAYQAGSFKTLFNKSLRASGLKQEGYFMLLLVFTSIYAILVSPSSAIALIPNLRWWQVPDPFNGQSLTAFLATGPQDLYSMDLLNPNQTGLYGCADSNYTNLCPGGGFNEIYTWSNANNHVATAPNITMTDIVSGAQRQLLSSTVEINDSRVAITTTHHQSILQLTGLFWDYLENHEIHVQGMNRPMVYATDDSEVGAALVQVQCNVIHYEDARAGNVSVTFPTDGLNNFTTSPYPTEGPQVNQSLYDFSRPLNTKNFTWADLAYFGNSTIGAPSLGALVTLPYEYIDPSNMTYQKSLLVPCTVDARWAASELSYDPTNGNTVSTNLTDPKIFARQYTPSDQLNLWTLTETPIYISPAWAAMLNVPGILANDWSKQEDNTTMILALLDAFISEDTKNGSNFTNFLAPSSIMDEFDQTVMRTVSTVLSMVIADGLSRSVYGSTAPLVIINDDPSNTTVVGLGEQAGARYNVPEQDNTLNLKAVKSALTYVTYSIKRYGYGYGWNASKTVKFGLAVLLLHAALAIIFMWYRTCCAVSKRRRWSSEAWGEVGELIALALVSSDVGPRKRLKGVSGGVKEKSTWSQYVRVRERGHSGLEMVVEPLPGSGDDNTEIWEEGVRVGKEYY